MTGAGDEAGEDQAVVFLSSFSVDNEEWSKRIDSGVGERIWRIWGWKSASGSGRHHWLDVFGAKAAALEATITDGAQGGTDAKNEITLLQK